jgi:hypothetical protein
MTGPITVGSPHFYVDPAGYPRQLMGQFVGGTYAAVTLNAASGTTPQTVLTVPAGQYCFIYGVQITLDATCTLGAAGMLNTTLSTVTGGQTVALLRSYIPALFTAPTVPTVIRQVSAPGAFFVTTAPGDTIQCANNTALTAGSIRVSFNYGFCNIPIGGD